uniref:Uncharacterized protein n=1 Tax=Ciona intestinalis TaxID=7719 RepID=H2XRR1_CIOIN
MWPAYQDVSRLRFPFHHHQDHITPPQHQGFLSGFDPTPPAYTPTSQCPSVAFKGSNVKSPCNHLRSSACWPNSWCCSKHFLYQGNLGWMVFCFAFTSPAILDKDQTVTHL